MKRRILGVDLGIAAALLALVPRAHAQAVTGELEGTVLDSGGSALAGAQVTIRGPGFRERFFVTDKSGHFRFLALPPGAYDVNISFIGRRPIQLAAHPVHIGQTTSLGKLVSHLQPIAIDSVIADAARPLLDPTTSAFGTIISKVSLQHLPNDRDYFMLASILPHVANSSEGLNFAGATGLENQYFIDGANITDPVVGPPSLALPYNFIKELEVRTGGYEAEYQGALGGVINAVTESGTNDLHVEAFAFYAGNRLGPEPRLLVGEVPRRVYSLYDVGASIGGPILRDRIWFFGAWNPALENQDVSLVGAGTFKDHSISHRFAGKVTWQPSAQSRIEFNAAGNPTFHDCVDCLARWQGTQATQFPKPDPVVARQTTGATALSARVTHSLSQTTLLEVSVDQSKSWFKTGARDGYSREPLLIDEYSVPGEVIWTGGNAEVVHVKNGHRTLDVRLTSARGRHLWKVGGELARRYGGGKESHGALTHRADGTWSVWDFNYDGDPVANRTVGAFAQDSWSITERLRLNYGLRWSTERVFGSDGRLALRFNNEWQPRIGVVYQPGSTRHHKIAASFGRFYQQVLLYAPTQLYTTGARVQFLVYDHDPRVDPTGGVGLDQITERSPTVVDLKGLYFDEFTAGYERVFGAATKASARVIRRELGRALEDGANYDTNFKFGNPGYGELTFLPRAERTYTALELSVEHSVARRAGVLASYVLSRTYGNYPGFFASDFGIPAPNFNSGFDQPDMLSSGLLPNDRPHVFKTSVWYRAQILPLTLGASFVWQSGTPRSEFGGTRVGPPWHGFVSPRGTAGRTPAIRDLNLRAAYRLPVIGSIGANGSLLLDLFHVGSAGTPLLFDQMRYYGGLDDAGNQTEPNPNYGRVFVRQAKMAGRIGVQIGL